MPYISLVLLCVSLVLAGCGARMVVPAGGAGRTAYAPLNEQARAGIVSYLNAGALPVRDARRASAYKQMYAQCHGRYRIVAEGTSNDGGSSIHWGYGIITHQTNQHVYIRFVCEPDVAHLPGVAAPAVDAPDRQPSLPLPAEQETPSPQTLVLAAADAFLYPMPSFAVAPTTLRLPAGSPVRVLTHQGQWVYVESATGARGWASRAWFKE